jgi:Tetratricopeptide repeat/Peptidase_C39 like family
LSKRNRASFGCRAAIDLAFCSRLAMLCFVAGLLVACGGMQTVKPDLNEGILPASFELHDVPFFPQEAYQCGPAALAMVLEWSGLRVTARDLSPEVYTSGRKGSLQTAIIGAARRHGRVAYPIEKPRDAFFEVAAGNPVIVLLNLGLSWYPKWHYAVMIGYDFTDDTVRLHSGTVPGKTMPLDLLERTWSRGGTWGLLVLPPAHLPAVPDESRYVAAVLGLEQAGQPGDAIIGYHTALGRWPDNLGAQIGLGNSHYGMGDMDRAEAAFREAALRHPESGIAFNNLAQTLLAQGRKKDALDAALRAVSIGGSLEAVYRQTLKEIQSHGP